ncbi:hypothetical protein Lal_00041061 [Lupinus albus]|nr:hypothetical protein Lal_00041061 [Lupinus albus]
MSATRPRSTPPTRCASPRGGGGCRRPHGGEGRDHPLHGFGGFLLHVGRVPGRLCLDRGGRAQSRRAAPQPGLRFQRRGAAPRCGVLGRPGDAVPASALMPDRGLGLEPST